MSTLAETSLTSMGHESNSFSHHDNARNKRLADVRRGAENYKKLDYIAETQWKSNVPRFPAVSRRVSSLPKITTSVLSEPDIPLRRSTFLNMTSTPRQSVSMMSASDSSYTEETVTPASQMSLPPNLSRISHHPTPFDYPIRENAEPRPDVFNTWGTNFSPLDDKTRLTAEDMKSREMPFHYRDNKKIVVKPIPRKGIPMSRVAVNDRERHQRTVTNFRSRNGTIRVIRPLDPLPEIEKYQKSYKPDVFDIENIEREKTFMMLERIDRILHPSKKSPRAQLGSSEEEIAASSTSSITIKDTADLQATMNQYSYRKSSRSPLTGPKNSPRWDTSLRSKDASFRSKQEKARARIRFNEDPFKRAPRTFSDVLHSLDLSEEDTDIKCEGWINDCLASLANNSQMNE